MHILGGKNGNNSKSILTACCHRKNNQRDNTHTQENSFIPSSSIMLPHVPKVVIQIPTVLIFVYVK